jgi:hypothetical protein
MEGAFGRCLPRRGLKVSHQVHYTSSPKPARIPGKFGRFLEFSAASVDFGMYWRGDRLQEVSKSLDPIVRMAGTTSQLSEWILKGARLQDSLERVSFGAASFQPHLVQAEQCAPRWDAGRGAPQLAVLPPLTGLASSRKQRSHRLSRAVVQAA